MRIRLSVLAVVAAVLASACSISIGGDDTTTTGGPSDAATTDAPATTNPSGSTSTSPPVATSTTTVAGIDVVVTGCDEADEPFDALCRAVDLIESEFVDDVDADLLVAGAVEGLEALDASDDATVPPASFECAIPDNGFTALCDAIAADVAEDGDTVAESVVQAIQGMIAFGIDDPYSAYLSPEALDLFSTNQSGSVEGIGALVQARETADDGTEVLCNLLSPTCRIYIVSPLEGSPAEAAGIMPGDILVGVDGEPVDGRTFDEVTADVRGPAGTDVDLTMERDGSTFEVTVTRAAIDIPVTDSRMLDEHTGYLRLTTFTVNSSALVRQELESLLDEGADTIIFDLQDNPGGSLNAAVSIASEFIGDGLVLRTESRVEEDVYEVIPGGVATDDDIRLVVLVDGGSASASEVVTGALQEADRAFVIGENTFGKNTVQRIWNLPGGGGLKLTIARWITPGGIDYGIDGITPDLRVDIPDDASSEFLVDAALDYLAGLDSSV